jgi:hypothetical protein
VQGMGSNFVQNLSSLAVNTIPTTAQPPAHSGTNVGASMNTITDATEIMTTTMARSAVAF